MTDIVKELRYMHAMAAKSCDPQFNRAIMKAAAEIERLRALQAEVGRLAESLAASESVKCRLLGEIERLRTSLRPFAEYPWDVEGVPDDAPLLPVNPQLKVGHVSDARMALYSEQSTAKPKE